MNSVFSMPINSTEKQTALHNSTRQETVDPPPRWAVAQRSSGTCSDVPESYSFLQRATASESQNIQTDVPAKYVARRPMDQNSSSTIQKDEQRNVTQRPMDQEANVLSFLSNVQPRRILNALQNGAPSPQNSSLSIINSSNSVFRQETTFSSPSNFSTIASHKNDEADDYVNSMSQFKTINSHSDPVYAPVPERIRNDHPMPFIAEPQIIPNLMDASMGELNCIFSSQSESELAANDSTSFNLRLNTFEDENDEFISPCGSTTFIKSLDGSNDNIISLDGSSISDATSVAQNLVPQCNGSGLLEELPNVRSK